MVSRSILSARVLHAACLLLAAVVLAESGFASSLRGRELATTVTITASWHDDLVAAVNVERASVGLAALCANAKLKAAAQKHTTDMALNNYLDHTGSNGSTLVTRVVAEGFVYTGVAENVAAGQQSVASVMASWMGSPGHRANIIGDYAYVGGGLAQDAASTYGTYWTLVLGSSTSEACACILKN